MKFFGSSLKSKSYFCKNLSKWKGKKEGMGNTENSVIEKFSELEKNKRYRIDAFRFILVNKVAEKNVLFLHRNSQMKSLNEKRRVFLMISANASRGFLAKKP